MDAQYHGGIAASSAESAGAKVLPNGLSRGRQHDRAQHPHLRRPPRLRGQQNVYRLERDAQGRILALHNYDPDKGSRRVTGGAFVVAATASRARACCCVHQRQIQRGLGNGSDMVGRHLMDHPSTSVTLDADEDLWLGRGPQSPSFINTMRDGPFRSGGLPLPTPLGTIVSTS